MRNAEIRSSDYGLMMVNSHISFESYKILSKISNNESLENILKIILRTDEFSDIVIRQGDKKVLNPLVKQDLFRFPFKGKVKTIQDKIYVLIQATLGCIAYHDFSLQQDSLKIFKAAERIAKFLTQFCQKKMLYVSMLSSITLLKCVKTKIWENSPFVSRQIEKIGPALSQLLVNSELTSFEKILSKNPRQLELILKRNPPFGSQIIDSIQKFPRYIADIITDTDGYKLRIEMPNFLTRKSHVESKAQKQWTHSCFVLVGDELNRMILCSKISDNKFFGVGSWEKRLCLKPDTKMIKVSVLSPFIVGVDFELLKTISITKGHGTLLCKKGPKRVAVDEELKIESTLNNSKKAKKNFLMPQGDKLDFIPLENLWNEEIEGGNRNNDAMTVITGNDVEKESDQEVQKWIYSQSWVTQEKILNEELNEDAYCF